jgi:hypothetical protein
MSDKQLFIILSLLMIFGSSYGVSSALSQTIAANSSVSRNSNILKAELNKNIGGIWRINYDESDNPLEKIQRTIEQKGSLEPESGEEKGSLPTVSISLFPPEMLSLEIGEGTLINEELKGITQTRLVYTDGVKRSVNLGAGANIAVTAAFTGNELKIETVSPRGNKMTETYALSASGDKLRVALQIDSPDDKELIVLNRVYNRVVENPFADNGEIQ